MKKIILTALLLLVSCSTTRFVDSWKNPDITSFEPDKLLVVGITENLTARKIFEEKLQLAFEKNNINTYQSIQVFDDAFTNTKRSREDIESLRLKLIEDGFDAVIITAVIGVDEKRSYRSGYYTFGYSRWYRFGPYYYRFQDVYYTPGYYKNFKVFHVESSIYDIREDEERSLVWVGTFDIVDPVRISETVDDYVSRIIGQLEKEGVVNIQ